MISKQSTGLRSGILQRVCGAGLSLSILVSLSALGGLPAHGQAASAQNQLDSPPPQAPAACPDPTGQPLRTLPEIRADQTTHVLDTTLKIMKLTYPCVPVWNGSVWFNGHMELRSYGYPTDPAGSNFAYGYPGPVLRVRRASDDGTTPGDRIRIKLVNALDFGDNKCDSPCPDFVDCKANPSQHPCCQVADVAPNCFHGNNATNLHFHGSHVSPRAPQDFVLLELWPERPASTAELLRTSHAGVRGTVEYGEYQIDVDPLRPTQPEGTHWYHPHKHGSTALQVLNGMAGALIVEGPFDDWLNGFYKDQGGLEEQILVVQQIDEAVNFYNKFTFTAPNGKKSTYVKPLPVVNGQANPVLTMKAGEIQRWRLIGATMQGSAQLAIGFGPELEAEQIALDGVRFSNANYLKQPLLPQGNLEEFNLSPGNRADFLVKAPAKPGMYALTYRVFGRIDPKVAATFEEQTRGLIQDAIRTLGLTAAQLTNPPLLTIKVEGAVAEPMTFPSELPPMPGFLDDIPATGKKRELTYTMSAGPGNPTAQFYINLQPGENRQYCPNCVDITTQLGSAEEWTVFNTTRTTNAQDQPSPFHVFHIHTNPFQVREMWGLQRVETGQDGTKVDVCGTTTYDPPIWMDSITLPSACQEAGKTEPTPGSIRMRQKYEEFTGEYVMHCHFLGHEDRGMMLSVQTVCPPGMIGPECTYAATLECPKTPPGGTRVCPPAPAPVEAGHGH